MDALKALDMVIVDTEGGKPGIVREVLPAGGLMIELVNEKGRADEWMPAQVRKVTVKEAGEAAKKFLKLFTGVK
jgi:hypothetical protein